VRILILSYYYLPDLGAGSFRTASLVKSLKKLNDKQIEIDIITTQPRRYQNIKYALPELQNCEQVEIFRVKNLIKSNLLFYQIIEFIYYVIKARKIAATRNYDLVFATSSRLMTAWLGANISRKKKIPLYLDIRDIFVDTLKDINLFNLNYLFVLFFYWIEKWTINSCSVLNLVSPGFENYHKLKYPNKKITFHTNGIDNEFIDISNKIGNDKFNPNINFNKKKYTILYAGNIGEGQGLEKIIPQFASQLNENFLIKIIGNGATKNKLKNQIEKMNLRNVNFSDSVSREKLILEYEGADILFLHLNSYPAFEKVIPSKLFEYAALGKPILAGVEGYPKKFIKEKIENAQVFTPCDAESALFALEKIQLFTIKRESFIYEFSRGRIMDRMASDLIGMYDNVQIYQNNLDN
jgi:glycosyltransferase involved in cell wall biosynthesis